MDTSVPTMMRPVRYQRYLLLQAVVLSCRCLTDCSARSWGDVIDHSIYMPTLVDPYRAATDDDPFDFEAPLEASPTYFPTSAPIIMPSMGSVLTLAPTAVTMECEANSYLHVIRMYDSWGDGWGDTKMTINTIVDTTETAESKDVGWLDTLLRTEKTILIKPLESVFEGSLVSGNDGLSYICLEVEKCYDIKVKGDQWQDEVKWEIRAVSMSNGTDRNVTDTIAKGQAPVDCQFSIPHRRTGELSCQFTCESLTRPPTPAPSRQPSSQPSESSSLAGTSTPAKSPANTRSFATPTNSSSVPSDLPSLSPSVVPSSPPSVVPSSPPSTVPSTTAQSRNAGVPAPSSGRVKIAPTSAPNAPSKSQSDSTFVPTSGSTFMMTMFGSSIWPTATAYPTFRFDPAMPEPSGAVAPVSATNPRTSAASAPASASKPSAPTVARNPTAGEPTGEAKPVAKAPIMPQIPAAPTRGTKPQVRAPTIATKPQARSPINAAKPQVPTVRGPTSSVNIPSVSLGAPNLASTERSNPIVSKPAVPVPSPSKGSVKLPDATAVPTSESTGGAAVFDAQQASSFVPTVSWFPTSSWSPTTVASATALPTTASGFSLTPSANDNADSARLPTTARSNDAPAAEVTADVVSSSKPSVTIADTPRPSRASNGDVYSSAGDMPAPPILNLLTVGRSVPTHHAQSLMYLELESQATNDATPSPGPSIATPLPTSTESSNNDDRIQTRFFENVGLR